MLRDLLLVALSCVELHETDSPTPLQSHGSLLVDAITSNKMTGGTPEVRSVKWLTFNI